MLGAVVPTAEIEPGCHLGNDFGCGFPAPDASIFEIEPYFGSFTKPVFLLLLGSLIIIIFFLAAFRNSKLIPGKLQSIGEMGYLFIRDGISREVIGKDGDRFVPLLFTLFFFVWIGNLWGIIPGAQFPVNSRFAFPVGLAITVWLIYMYLGMRHQGPIKFFTNMMFPPGMPKAIYVILAPIELISNVLVRPVTLSIRLFANMFAGHLLLTVFTVATFYLASLSLVGILGSATSFLMTIIFTAFEALIQALQAYIFTLLTAVYIAGSLHAEH